MANKDKRVEISEEELRRLRASVEAANVRVQYYADQVSGLIAENEDLLERLRVNQNQMRIMRNSTVWRAGGVFRKAKRTAGVVLRNAVGMIRS